MSKLIQSISLCIGIYCLSIFCHNQTDGFAVGKLSTTFLSGEQEFESHPTLSKKYTYWTKGGQSYVFLSEDGQYVLKFLRSSRKNFLTFARSLIPLEHFDQSIQQITACERETLQSFKIAENHIPEHTGLVFLHTHRNSKPLPTLQIIDNLGIQHTIDANKYPFMIQRRAIPVKEAIDQMMTCHDFEGAQQALSGLFDLIHTHMERGIADGDPNLVKNFGFIQQEPIQIDLGRFSMSAHPTITSVLSSAEDLQHWINAYHPALSTYFQTALTQFCVAHEMD